VSAELRIHADWLLKHLASVTFVDAAASETAQAPESVSASRWP